MAIKVSLTAGPGFRPKVPPGRILLASTAHSFAELGFAIDRALARWELNHDHEFKLADGTTLMLGGEPELDAIDSITTPLSLLRAGVGTRFEYVFDLGSEWEHQCEVVKIPVPVAELADMPPVPVPVFGWGMIPDQHGRKDGSDFVP